MPSLRRSTAMLAAISLALSGCAGTSGGMRQGDDIRVLSLYQGPPLVGSKAPADVPNLGMVAYVCGPLALFCLPALVGAQAVIVANQPVAVEGPAAEREVLKRAVASLHGRENLQAMFVASIEQEAAARWRISPNAASSLTVIWHYVGVRPGPDGQPLLEMIARSNLKLGTDPTGITANVGLVRPFGRPDWRDDPAAFDEEMHAACRDLAREIVRKFST